MKMKTRRTGGGLEAMTQILQYQSKRGKNEENTRDAKMDFSIEFQTRFT
jgi:hypothetical protein